MFGSRFIDNGSIDFDKVFRFEKEDASASFPFFVMHYTFLPLDPENGAQLDLRRLRIT